MHRLAVHPTVRLAVLATVLVLAAVPAAADDTPSFALAIDDTGILFFDVELRPGAEADIHVTVIGDVNAKNCQVTLHGGPFTAETWRPYAEALGDGSSGEDICVLAIDMPARGESSVPRGIVFGELLLDDYVNVVLGVLDRLEALDIEPRTLVGHSMGGIVAQMVQQRLVDKGTSLEKRYDISEAILVAPDYPRDVPWGFVDSGAAGPIIGSFIISDPTLGNIMEIPAEAWPAFYFTNLAGEIVDGAPTPAEVVELGYIAPGEPELGINQLLGLSPFAERPRAEAGIFAEDTRLRVVAYENDGFILLEETPALYTHLTGDPALNCFVPVLGPGTTHATQISDPELLVTTLAAFDDCEVEVEDEDEDEDERNEE